MEINKIKRNFFVFDTETTKLEPMPKNFVFGVIMGSSFHKVLYSVEDFKKEFENPIYKNKYIFAHNAEFDLLSIFGNIITEVDNSAVFNGKFIAAKYKNNITFGDSMNIYPASVEKIGAMMGLEKLDNLKVRSQKLRKDNITEEDIEYCKRDCKIIFKALQRMFESIGVIKLTVPSLAMFQFRSQYLPKDIVFSEIVDDFYESYYGGRTEAFRIGKVKAEVYDINSLYPYAMIHTVFPDVKHLHKILDLNVKYLLYLLNDYEGLAKVTVRHKETYFGYLPVRMEINKSEKLVFPVGEFTTTVNFNELRFAIDEGVVEVLKVHYVIYANPVESPFVTFVNDNYKKRLQSPNELDKTIYKLIMNSLYGRFAMKMKMSTTYYDNLPYQLIAELEQADKFYDLQLFNIERNDCYLITENEQMKNSFFSIPAYSSYITSYARVKLLKAMIANEKSDVCYCDTDSIFLMDVFMSDVSGDIGDFKKEPKIVTEINGLKNYKYINGEGKETTVIKGISRNSTKISENSWSTKKYYKTKQSIVQNKEAGESFEQTKTLKHIYDKRTILADGNTKPIKLSLSGNDI